MSKRNITSQAADKILSENFESIMGDRFGRYSKYIIQDRALPDARDGLKPVQRRILFAMFKLGLASNKPFKKSARIVGDVIGKYHPHGDTAVYEALIRMSQDFKCLLPLVDIHGNNGSIDGDPAAAMRYTEARMSRNAELMISEINKRTVGFVPNFDDEELEPVVLPAKFPNLLVNGASGISAGYATEIPPHNPGECIDATIYRLEHPECSLDDLLQIVKGPDFPTGGIVQGIKGLHDAYKTGRGKVVIKSKVDIDRSKVEPRIVITEIPFDVNKAVLLKKMSEQLTLKNVDGVKMIRDESDRFGLRIVIEIRRDASPEDILNFLLKTTELQKNYNYNMVAISRGKPCYLGLVEAIDSYIEHEKEVVRNRCNFDLERALLRDEIVKGLISMVSILDAVITTIRNSKNKADAKINIMSKYGFTDHQAEAIVMLQLYRLTNTDIFELKEEEKELQKEIKNLKRILSNDHELVEELVEELRKTKEIIDCPRKTLIEEEISDVSIKTTDIISKDDVSLIISRDGYVKRISKRAFGTDEDLEKTKLKEGDIITDVYSCTTVDVLLQFTNFGNYIYLPVHIIPEVKHKDLGYHVSTLITMEPGEKVIFSFPVSNFNDEIYVMLATKLGLVKHMKLDSLNVNRFSKALKATKLRDGDEVVSVDIAKDLEGEVVVCTKEGFMNRYDAKEISLMEPSSYGVKAMELKNRPDDTIVGLKFVKEKDIILILTNRGNIKRLRTDEIQKGRKNHVGKLFIKQVKSNPHEVVNMDVIHDINANAKLFVGIDCGDSFVQVDYTVLRIAIADNGRKFVDDENKQHPERLIIARNDKDLEL